MPENKQKKCPFCHKDKDGYVSCFGAFSIHRNNVTNEWHLHTGHCKSQPINFCPKCGRELGGEQNG